MPISGPKEVQDHYKKCRTRYPDRDKSYCARIAWNIYCSEVNPDYEGCTEFGKKWGPPYSAPLSANVNKFALIAKALGV